MNLSLSMLARCVHCGVRHRRLMTHDSPFPPVVECDILDQSGLWSVRLPLRRGGAGRCVVRCVVACLRPGWWGRVRFATLGDPICPGRLRRAHTGAHGPDATSAATRDVSARA